MQSRVRNHFGEKALESLRELLGRVVQLMQGPAKVRAP